jgi:16S rRNA (uracil1498-N3)-methyltransferase
MQIRRFYCPEIPARGEAAVLPADEARHAVQVLRLRPGDPLVLLDGAGVVARAEVLVAGPRWRDGVRFRVLERITASPPKVRIHLYIAPPRGKAMGQLVRAATELGIWKMIPVLCAYGVRRAAPGRDVESGWEADRIAAMKQSGNPYLPEMASPVSFAEALETAPATGVFGAVPRDKKNITGDPLPHAADLALWIGPEGGFDENEEQSLLAGGYRPMVTGRWILRVETAVPALLGNLLGRLTDD